MTDKVFYPLTEVSTGAVTLKTTNVTDVLNIFEKEASFFTHKIVCGQVRATQQSVNYNGQISQTSAMVPNYKISNV